MQTVYGGGNEDGFRGVKVEDGRLKAEGRRLKD